MWCSATFDLVSATATVAELGALVGGSGAAVSSIGGRSRNGKLQSENGWRVATRVSTRSPDWHVSSIVAAVGWHDRDLERDVAGVLTIATWSDGGDDRLAAVIDPDQLAWLGSWNGWVEWVHHGLGPPPAFRSNPDGALD